MDSKSFEQNVADLLGAYEFFESNPRLASNFDIQKANLLESSNGQIYTKYLFLKGENASYPKRITEVHDKYCGKLISRHDLAKYKHEELLLNVRFDKIKKEFNEFTAANSGIIHLIRTELSELDRENETFRRRQFLFEKIYASNLNAISVPSVVTLKMNSEIQTYIVVPMDYWQSLTIEAISPSSPVAKVIIGQKIGFSAEIQIEEYKTVKISVENFRLPEKRILLLLSEIISNSRDQFQHMEPSVKSAKVGRWRDAGREDDIVVFCPKCGIHPLYEHNVGCNR